MNNSRLLRKIYRLIRKYDRIVITRHIGPDPDALGSQLGLKEAILTKFPNKQVYAVGAPASTFRYIGQLDKFNEDLYNNSLLIVLDTPDLKRVDDVNPVKFKESIKIDHHPFVEKFCKYEYIDDTASSASQIVLELIYKTPLKITTEIAKKLFVGIIADTNRFLFKYTTPKTFTLVSKMIKDTNLDFTEEYNHLYLKPLKEKRFQGFIADNMIVTENGFGYMKVTDEMLKKYNVDAATAGNMVNSFNYINEIYAWAIFSEDKNIDLIRGSIRSRGPIINDVAAQFGGGGHVFASGVRLKTDEEIDKLVIELDKVCKEYKEREEN